MQVNLRWVLFVMFTCVSPMAQGQNYCQEGSEAAAVDLSTPVTTNFLNAMKSYGIGTIIRYYDYDPPTLPNKTLRRAERDQIINAGLKIGVVFQHHNNQFSSFHAERGSADAERSLFLAAENSQPKGSAIYFGVDGNWSSAQQLEKIIEYFSAAKQKLEGSGYKLGVYGSGLVCRTVIEKGIADLCWLANAKSWPEYQSYYATKKWKLVQTLPKTCGGLNVDFNLTNSTDDDFGQFGAPQ